MPDRQDRATADAPTVCRLHGSDPARLLEILQDLQQAQGWIAEPQIQEIASTLNLSRAEVHGVVSFYHDFRRSPAGRLLIKACRGEACQSMGAGDLIEGLCRKQGIAPGGTSEAGVTVEEVYCLGNCALAPAAQVQGRLYGRLDAGRLESLVESSLA